jgi:hypothetical protein
MLKMPGMVCMTVIPAFGRVRQKDLDFEASLGYIGETLSKNKKKRLRWKILCYVHFTNF